jgi:hypothetical protein
MRDHRKPADTRSSRVKGTGDRGRRDRHRRPALISPWHLWPFRTAAQPLVWRRLRPHLPRLGAPRASVRAKAGAGNELPGAGQGLRADAVS